MTLCHHGSFSLAEAAAKLNMLRLACDKCGRRGQYSIDRLLQRYGPDIALPDLRHELAQCSRRGSDPCQVGYIDLFRNVQIAREDKKLRRRQFIALLGGAITAQPITTCAQQATKVYRVALVVPSRPIAMLSETGGIPEWRAWKYEFRRLRQIRSGAMGQNRAQVGDSRKIQLSQSIRPVTAP
jgi:hypothetical protein